MTSVELLERPPPAPPAVELRLLRAFELRLDGEPLLLPSSAQRLVTFLALHDRPLQRGFIAGSLWLDTTDERAAANLRSTLWRLRRGGVRLVTGNPTHLALDRCLSVDLHEAGVLARQLLDRSAAIDGGGLSGHVLGLMSHDLLPDWLGDDFVLVEQERWRQLRIHALEALAERLQQARRFAEAIDAALAAVAAEPLRESAHRTLLCAHLAEGNVAEAIRCYESFRSLLHRELGLPPSAAMEALLDRRAV